MAFPYIQIQLIAMFEFRARVLPILLFLLPVNCCLATIRYVNINNPTPGAGNSWATAYQDLNQALAVSVYGDQVWVAQGTYLPTATNDRTISFLIQHAVNVYGGFTGVESTLAARNWTANPTILSGDIGVAGDFTDNSYNVVTITNNGLSATLDGFTVEYGNGNQNYPATTAIQPYNQAGGVLVVSGPAVYTGALIEHCILSSNFGVYGGGVCTYAYGGSSIIEVSIVHDLFQNNTSVLGGGVMWASMNGGNGLTSVESCIFVGNSSPTGGGSSVAVDVDGSGTHASMQVYNSTFYNNSEPLLNSLTLNTGTANFYTTDCIMWKSGAAYTGPLNIGASTHLQNSDLDLAVSPGTGNTIDDPQFVDAPGGDFHLQPCSPDIDLGGMPVMISNVDYGGNARIQNNSIDWGAYESAKTTSPSIGATPATYCQNSTAHAIVSGTGTNILWYTTATGGVGDPVDPVPSTTTVGSTQYWVTQTVAGECESTRWPVTIKVLALPAAPTTTPVQYCENTAAAALTASGTSLRWYTVPTGGTAAFFGPTPSTTSNGSTTYYVTQTDGNNCESPRAPLVVTINSQPAAPAVTPVGYCENATATALTASGTGLLWYTAATGGTGTSTAPTPSTTATGTTTYYVSQTSGCESPRAPIAVTISGQPAAPTATSPTYCQYSTAVALTASGTNLLWYTTATGGVGDPTPPTPSTTGSGSTTYYVSQTSGCESPRTPIAVLVNAQPAAPTATPPTYCQYSTAVALTASGTNLLWYTTATGGTGSSSAPTPSTTATGTTTYYVSQTSGCESPRSPIAVQINSQPAAPVVTSPIYCQNTTANPLTASGTNLLWYTAATGGTGTSTAPTPSTMAVGATTYYVSQTSGCESPRSPLLVTINSQPAAPAVTHPTYCQNTPAAALTASGTNLLWYTAATGGVGDPTPPMPSTTATGTTTWWVSQTSGCESPRNAFSVTVNPNPTADFTLAPVCAGKAAIIKAVAGVPAPDNYAWDFGNASSVTGSGAGPYEVVWPSGGDYTITLTNSTGTCENQAAHDITVYPQPQVDISPVNTSLCAGNPVTLNATGASDYQWSPATDLSDPAIGNPVALLEKNILYTVTGTDGNGCVATAQIFLQISADCLGYYIPDAFTPNGDGHNDLWRIKTADTPKSFGMILFNRYGGKVFESKDVNAGWNGTIGGNPAMSGTYVYVIMITTSAGTTIEKKGTVLLIR